MLINIKQQIINGLEGVVSRMVPLVTLRTCRVFSELSDAALTEISRRAAIRQYARGSTLLAERDEQTAVFCIVRGRVKNSVVDVDGREVILSVFGGGDILGETLSLDGVISDGVVSTLEETEVVSIPGECFWSVAEREWSLSVALMRNLAHRLQCANRHLQSLVLEGAPGRVYRTLREMGTPEGELRVVYGRLSQQSIASMVGTSRETVGRSLKALREQGLLSQDLRGWVVHPCG